MNRKIPVIFVIVSALIGLGGCIFLVIAFLPQSVKKLNEAVVTDPAEVSKITAGMAAFQVPEGYNQTGINFLGMYQGVTLSDSSDSQKMIMLFAVPNITQMEQQQFEQMLQNQIGSGQKLTWETVSSKPVEIRSVSTNLVLRKGSGPNGESFQMESGVFQGIKSPVILMIAGPTSKWDQEKIDGFIQSIQ